MNRHFERITTKGTLLRMVVMLALLACTTACEKNDIRTFHMGSDELTAVDENGTKLYLNHLEQWLYWEEDDDIYVFTTDADGVCKLISGANTQTAYFKSQTEIGEEGQYAIYPASAAVVGNSGQIKLPNTFTYGTNRTGTSKGTHIDSSFAKDAMPMVSSMTASSALGSDATFFHVVAGMVRIQLFSSSAATISSIEFESVAKDAITKKQISGVFNIVDPNDYQPYVAGTSTAAADCKITVNDSRTIGPSQLQTYYIPLPATRGDDKTTYAIQMTVNSNLGKCVKNFTVDIHRRNITMLPALEITSWTGSGSANISMVGSGTKDRPFQIYDVNDMVKVRTAFATSGKINGQTITADTYFRIVRSDIELTKVNWNNGIMNFTGHMYFAANSPTQGNITNTSDYPIFTSISANGEVSYFYVKGTKTYENAQDFSPLCGTNNGTLLECRNLVNLTMTQSRIAAGLCVTNNGKIIGGANAGSLRVTGAIKRTAGICAYNSALGEIQGNFTVSAAVPVADSIAGICYENSGKVYDCLVNLQPAVNTNGHWGTVVFHNMAGATVQNCIGNGSVKSGNNSLGGSIGGIVYRNFGKVSNCMNHLFIAAAYGSSGGIVAYQHGNSAITYNCYSDAEVYVWNNDANESTHEDAGGIMGDMTGGTLANCYNRSTVDVATNAGGIIGRLTGGNIYNCWSDVSFKFCGIVVPAEAGGTGAFVKNCFSRYTSDYTNKICTLFETTGTGGDRHYTIKAGSILTRDAVTAGDLLSVPLNAWVASPDVAASNPDYYTWTQTGLTPLFYTGAKARIQGSFQAVKNSIASKQRNR